MGDGATWHYTVTAQGLTGAGQPSASASATTYTAAEKWRLAHFGTTSNSGDAADAADPDADGWTNHQEYVSGTTPDDPASLLKISQMRAGGNDMVLEFGTVSGRTYRLERSLTLEAGSWTTVQDDIVGTGGVIEVTDADAALHARRFYRIVVTR